MKNFAVVLQYAADVRVIFLVKFWFMSDPLKPIRTAYKRAIQVWFCEYNGPPMDCQRRTKPSSLAFNIEPTDPFSESFLWFSIGLIRVFLRFELEINFISRFRIFFKAIASLITVPYFIPSHSIYAPTWSRKTRPARIFSCFHVAEWRETFDFRLNNLDTSKENPDDGFIWDRLLFYFQIH